MMRKTETAIEALGAPWAGLGRANVLPIEVNQSSILKEIPDLDTNSLYSWLLTHTAQMSAKESKSLAKYARRLQRALCPRTRPGSGVFGTGSTA